MMEKSYTLKFHAGIICDALHRNIDDTFESVSFEIHSNGLVQVKIILDMLNEEYQELIDDISAETVAQALSNNILSFIVSQTAQNESPLENIVYRRARSAGDYIY